MLAQFLVGSNLNFIVISVSDYLVELGHEEIYATLLISLTSGASLVGSLTNGIISQRLKIHALKFQCVCFFLSGLYGMALSLTRKIEALTVLICAIVVVILTSSDDYPPAIGIVTSSFEIGGLVSGPILGM